MLHTFEVLHANVFSMAKERYCLKDAISAIKLDIFSKEYICVREREGAGERERRQMSPGEACGCSAGANCTVQQCAAVELRASGSSPSHTSFSFYLSTLFPFTFLLQP